MEILFKHKAAVLIGAGGRGYAQNKGKTLWEADELIADDTDDIIKRNRG